MKTRLIVTFLLILMTAPCSKAISGHDDTIGSDSEEPGVYIIRLADPPLALYEGDIPGLSATRARSLGEKRLDARSSASRAYRRHLSHKQDQIVASLRQRIDPSLTPIYRYETAFNGMALWLTPGQAAEMADLPEVVSVQQDKLRQLMTDTTPALVNAEAVWDGTGTGGLPGTQGEGVIIGIIDSGVWPEHPSFADDGTYPPPPLKWGGKCTPPADGTKGYTCNNKLIGIQFFLDAYIAREERYNGLFRSGRDDNGHGTYTASIAAGNKDVPASIYGIDRSTVSGMAPRAHISVYKAVGPDGATQGDLLAAIDKAVADGVDVINYSIGSSFDSTPWGDPDALAFLAAREAGIFVTVSAGNSGPDSQTIGSPGNAPWLVTVGASYPDRLFLSNIEIRSSAPDSAAAIQNFSGASPTKGISDFNLIDAEGIPDIEEDTSGNCLNPFPTGTFRSSDAVLCKRGDAPGPAKGNFVQDGGAGAILLYNDEKSNDFNSYAYPIPAVFISDETGLEIKERIKTSESPLLISFTQGDPVYAPDPRIVTDTVAAFSSRGPSIFSWIDFQVLQVVSEHINIIKPDVTAPGTHILAGASPEYMINANGNTGRFGHQGDIFQISQGTSMSSPHVAGLGALLLTLHPDWSPTQIQSALMLTAVNENQIAKGAEGNIPATPFDAGSGRVDVSRAARAGFTLDETGENFRAANPEKKGEPSALNLPGLTNAECLGECTWKRTVESAADIPINWSVQPGETSPIIAEPSNFILNPGETQEIFFTANVRPFPAGQWIFSDIHFTPEPADTEKIRNENSSFSVPPAHFPVAIRPIAGVSPVNALEIETRRNQGTYTLGGLTSIETDSLTVTTFLGEPEFFEGGPLAQDSENDQVYDDPDDGIFVQLLPVPGDVRRLIVEITDTSANDLDLYIGRDENNNGKPDPDEELCKRARSSWNESCDLSSPGEQLHPGNYWVMIQNYKASDEELDEFTFSITRVDEETKIDSNGTGPIRASGPSVATLDESFDIKITWDIPEFEINETKEGWLEIGTDASHAGNIAAMPLTLSRIEDDVTTTYDEGSVHPGDTLTYTIRIKSDNVHPDTQTYTLVSTIPEGMTYIPGSATVEPTEISENKLAWTVETGHSYAMSTNSDNPFCKTPYGGYANMADLDISGDNVTFRFDDFLPWDNTKPLTFFGKEYPDGLWFTDDGIILLNPADISPFKLQTSNFKLHPSLFPFWQDMEIVYDEAENRGVSLGEGRDYLLIEYNGLEPAPAGSTDSRFDFEMLMRRSVSNVAGIYEIIFAYNTIKGDIPLNTTIGLENEDGTRGVQYTGDIENGLVICFDSIKKDTVNISYEVSIDEDIISPGGGFSPPRQLFTTLEHTVTGGKLATAETAVTVIENPMLNISSGEITLAIPDETEVTSSLYISRKVAVSDLNITLNIQHPHPSDLSAWLISPSGTEITLFNHLTATRENFTGTLLDDDAKTLITDTDAPFTGDFRPAEPLDTFSGEVTEGEWALKIYDDQPWDEGVLLSWSLDFKFESAGPVANEDMAVTGKNEPVSIDVLLNDTDTDGDPLMITSVSVPSRGTAIHDGKTVIYTPEPGFIGEDTFTYIITDNSEGTAQGDVRVTVKQAGVTIIVTTLSDRIADDESISLREALLAAETNQSIDGSPKGGFRDTIVLPPGRIQLDSLDITQPLRLVGSPEGTILQGKESGRMIHIHENADVEIQNLTIQGRTENPSSAIDHSPFTIHHSPFPWMAILTAKESAPGTGRFCSGTLIHPEWVLTSGQCAAYGMENGFDVTIGLPYLSSGTGEPIQPEKTLIHPDFDPVTLDSDIALIHLSVPSAQPIIDLILPGDPIEMAKPGTSATAMGWSVTEVGSGIYTENFFEISVPIVENEKAGQHYEEHHGIIGAITGNMLAAGDEERKEDSCTDISGGPLVLEISNPKSQIPSSLVQAGIVSWGCDLPGDYSVYTRISQFTSWIYEQVGGLPPFDADIAGGVLNQGRLLISGSTLTGNSGIRGGAIHNMGMLTLLNSTVSGNSATLGGGIFNQGSLRMIFSTIAKNEARYGGGIFNEVKGTSEIKNTLIAGNSPTVTGSDLLGTITTRGNNLIKESAGGSGYQHHDLLDLSPLMVPLLMSNGGPTLTHAIQVNGPIADAADCTDMEGKKVEADQRGVERQGQCDIGAFEYDERDYPPVASDDLMFTIEKPVTVDVLQNDRDANGDDLFIVEFSEPENGMLKTSSSSLLTYTPNEGFLGTDTFTYMITDGMQMSEALVTVTTLPDNSLVVQDDEALTQANTPVVIQVLSNDSDIQGNPLEVIEAGQPANGSTATDGAVITYSPAKDFTGIDQFIYRITNGVKIGKAFVFVIVGDPYKCHSADYNPRDYEISLSEMLRVIQIYTNGAYTCGDSDVEDGYELGPGNWKLETGESEIGSSKECTPHHSDYNPQDWRISLSELLRLIQLYNSLGYHLDPDQEDGFGLKK